MIPRDFTRFSLLILICFLVGCKPSLDADLVLVDINVVDVENGSIIKSKDVVIKNDRIIRITNKGEYNFNSKIIIDGQDKYLIPGLWDMHVHIREYEDIFFPLFIAHGVTGVRDMFNPTVENLKKWKSQVNNSGGYKPRLLLTASNIVDGPPVRWPGTLVLEHPDSAHIMVKRMKDKGADFIKIYDKLSEQAYMAIVEECNRQKIPFAGHVPDGIALEDAIKAGQRSIEHLDDFSINLSPNSHNYRKKIEEAADQLSSNVYRAIKQQIATRSILERDEQSVEKLMTLLKKNDCWPSTAIFNIFDQLSNRPYLNLTNEDLGLNFYPDSLARKYRKGLQQSLTDSLQSNIRKLFLAKLKLLEDFEQFDVPFLAGSDASPIRAVVPGLSLHRELEIMSRANISNATLLKSATLYPAVFMGIEKDYGSVSENKIADLVILNGNPLDDISNTQKIEAVILKGEHLSKEELDKVLKEVEKKSF